MNKVTIVINNGYSYILNSEPVMPGTRLYNSIVNNTPAHIPEQTPVLTFGNPWRITAPIEFDLDQLSEGIHYHEVDLTRLMRSAPITTPRAVWEVLQGMPATEHDLEQPMVYFPVVGVLCVLDNAAKQHHLVYGGFVYPKALVVELLRHLTPKQVEELRKDGLVKFEPTECLNLPASQPWAEEHHHPELKPLFKTIGVHREVIGQLDGAMTLKITPIFNYEELLDLYIKSVDYPRELVERDRALLSQRLSDGFDARRDVVFVSVDKYQQMLSGIFGSGYGPAYQPQQMPTPNFNQRDAWNREPQQGGQYPEMLKPQGW